MHYCFIAGMQRPSLTIRAAAPPPQPCAVLDMVTDRVATACLLAVLAARYPAAHLPFLLLIMLDIFRWEPPSPTLVLVGSVLLSSCLFQPAAATPARCCAA
jgi:hypothetical protein